MGSRRSLGSAIPRQTLLGYSCAHVNNISTQSLPVLRDSVKMCLPKPPVVMDTQDSLARLPSVDVVERMVLVLATGGTLCMKPNDEGAYEAVPRYIPETLKETAALHDAEYFEEFIAHRCQCEDTFVLPKTYASSVLGCKAEKSRDNKVATRVIYTIHEYSPLIDSSNMGVSDYKRIAADISRAYHEYDGFVILHGTDTLAYTASTLSFMLENLGKPVVLTGAQVPAAEMRTDAFDNIIGSLVIAGNYKIPEVSVFFNRCLYRGNRVQKVNADEFDAFDSPNLAPLVKMGIHIQVNHDAIWRSKSLSAFKVAENWNRNIGLLRLFPAITADTVKGFLSGDIKGVVLQTYGAGNGPSERVDIMKELKAAADNGILIVNTTQCQRGCVTTAYAAGLELEKNGVICGSDMTTEAALAKLSYICGFSQKTTAEKRVMISMNLRGELTPTEMDQAAMKKEDLKFIDAMAAQLSISSEEEMQRIRSAIYPPMLCHAARYGNLDELKALKEKGADYNSSDYDKRTPLHIACAEGVLDIVQELLLGGASVHARDRANQTPLFDAVQGRHMSVIKLLATTGARISIRPDRMASILCRLANNSDTEGLEAWLTANADTNAKDYDGRTPLQIGASNGDVKVCEMLLSAGADPNMCDKKGHNSLYDALKHCHVDAIRLLISSGAVIQEPERNLANRLCQYASEGNLAKLKAWKLAGVDMNLLDYDGRTALHIACHNGHEDVIKFLLDSGARPDGVDRHRRSSITETEQANLPNRDVILDMLRRKSIIQLRE